MARLFPAAYKDDPLQSLEFETNLGDAPRAGKLAAIDTWSGRSDGPSSPRKSSSRGWER